MYGILNIFHLGFRSCFGFDNRGLTVRAYYTVVPLKLTSRPKGPPYR